MKTFTIGSNVRNKLRFFAKNYLFYCALLFGLLQTQLMSAQTCDDAVRWEEGGHWNDDGTIDEQGNIPQPQGIIRCGNAADTQSNISGFLYDSANYPGLFTVTYVTPPGEVERALIDGVVCLDPDPQATGPTPPISEVEAPTDGNGMIWINFDVRANAGSSEFQIISNSGMQNIVWALYYSESPGILASGDADGLSGDCSELALQACGTDFNGWADFAFPTPVFDQITNYYLAIWDINPEHTGNAFPNVNFKARFGCGDGDLCLLREDNVTVECQENGEYTVEVDFNGINGLYGGVDAAAKSISSDVCLSNISDGGATSGTITFTYDAGVPYNYSITRIDDCEGNTVSNSGDCTITGGDVAPDCCDCTDYTVPPNGGTTVECPNDANGTGVTAPTIITDCGEELEKSGPVIVDSPDPVTCEGTRTYTWTYTDCEQNTFDWDYVYTIDYTGGVTAPTDETETVECPDDAVNPGAPATVQDACGRDVVPVYVGVTSDPDPVTCEGTVEYKWSYTDCTGEVVDYYTYTYTIDYTGGVTAPTDDTETVECPDDAVNPGAPATVQDACGRDVVPVYVGVTSDPDPVTCEGTVEYKWSYTDCTGEVVDYYTYTYTIDYTGGVTAPTDDTETVECPDDAVNPGAPATVQDACGRDVVPVYVGVTSDPDPVTCEGTVEYKWSYTDCTGEVVDYYTYTYTIDYTGGVTAPTDDTETVECPDDAVNPGAPATVQDACGRDVVPVYVGVTSDPDPVTCEGTVEYKWSYTDCTGEVVDYYTYTYTIDYTGGVTAPTDDTETVECPDDAVNPGAPASVKDACGRDVVPVYVGVTSDPDPVTCEGTVEYKWSYTDCTGEVVDYYTYTYTIDYTGGVTAPTDDTETVECPDDAVNPGAPASVKDACGRDVVPVYVGVTSDPDPVTCEGTVEYKWSYTDCTGEVVDYYTYTYTIDYTGGVTAPTDETETVECPDDAVNPGAPATVQDACGRDVVPVYVGVTSDPDPVTCEGTVEYKWSYTDCTGEVVDYYTYTYTIDYTGGVTAPTDETETVECPDDAVNPGAPATVQDACGRDVVPVYVGVTSDPDPVTCEGTVEYKWSYTDCTGEVVDYYTYTYTIDYTGGVTAPTDDTETVECPDDAVNPGAPASVKDACGRDVVPVYVGVTSDPDPVTCEGTVEYKWSYTDCTGEVVDYYTYTYTIDYTGGVTAPTDDTETVECPDDAVNPGAPASVKDACGRDVVPVYVGVTSDPDPVTCEGTVEYKWSYTDCTGEVVDYYTYTYTIDYTGGVTAPTDDTETVECPDDAVNPGAPATVQDACGRDVVPVYVGVTSDPDPVTCEGTVEYKWSYTDCTGEVVDYYTYTYTIDDPVAPECPKYDDVCIDAGAFVLTGATPEGGVYSGLGVSYDDESGNYIFDPAAAGEGTHEIVYTYEPCSDCFKECKFNITVYDLPEVKCPENMIVCLEDGLFKLGGGDPEGGIFNGEGVSCDENGDCTFDPSGLSEGVYDITYSYEDGNGCSNSCVFTIEVVDCCEDETAYAFAPDTGQDEWCFLESNLINANRWGWTLGGLDLDTLIDTDTYNTYTFDLYAASGNDCDPTDEGSPGTLVGTVTLSREGDNVLVTYVMNDPTDDYSFKLDGTVHVYAGCDPYPRRTNGSRFGSRNPYTVAPGQYPYSGEGDDSTATVTIPVEDLSECLDDFYLIAHAGVSVCEVLDSAPSIANDESVDRSAIEANINFNAYPVPFKDKVTIEYNLGFDTDVTIEVFDMRGFVIDRITDTSYSKDLSKSSIIDLSRFKDRVLFVKLSTNKGSVVKKLISSNEK